MLNHHDDDDGGGECSITTWLISGVRGWGGGRRCEGATAKITEQTVPCSKLGHTAAITDVIVETEGVKLPGGCVCSVRSGQAEGHCHSITQVGLAEGHSAIDPT